MSRHKRPQPQEIFKRLSKGNLASQTYLAASLLDAAFQLAVQTERNEAADELANGVADHAASALASIVLSVAFLEGFLNELIFDTGSMIGGQVGGAWLGMPTSKRIARLDDLGAFRGGLSVLQKYQLFLAMADRPAIREDKEPFQAGRVLCQLRNALIHYEPEWIVHPDSGPPSATDHGLSDSLRGRFRPGPRVKEGTPFFPHGCMGSPAALWACRTALSVPDAFFAALGIEDTVRHLNRLIPVRIRILEYPTLPIDPIR